MSPIYYLDTSAAVKLVMPEPETPALLSFLNSTHARCVSAQIIVTELMRAVQRHEEPPLLQARKVLTGISLITPNSDTFSRAGLLPPATLRSLDALHLATALTPGAKLTGFITYDLRLAEAAIGAGLDALRPGLE